MKCIIILILSIIGYVLAPSPFSRQNKAQNLIGTNANAFSNIGPFGTFGPFGSFGSLANQSPVPQSNDNRIPINDRYGIFDVVYEWKILDYQFPSPQHREAALRSGEFVPQNNLPLGIDRWRNK